MTYNEEDFLMISGIQHFVFCPRQWALIHLENAWQDNEHTIKGILVHEKAHDPFFSEKRGSLIIVRQMPIFSRTLGITGQCDVVEFRQDNAGVPIFGREGLWLPCPVEYKKGQSKQNDADRIQLCAQAICLEEMLACPPIEFAYLFYWETKRRETVTLDTTLRKQVADATNEMRGYFERNHTPRVKSKAACKSCSLRDICLPKLPATGSVQGYINKKLREDMP